MSAIFGIINKKGGAVDAALAYRMQEALIHRAVDGKGTYKNENVFLGHHKLIVHRRQISEKQPLEMGDFVITADARIDNVNDLLPILNIKEVGVTDSFVILKAFEKWGRNCVHHLKGEFCFAIWNKKDETLFSANDHIGFKSFYYYENDHLFAFSSMIKALEAIKIEKLEINPQIFIDYYSNVFTPITYDKKIHLLQGGHTLILNKGFSIKKNHYWVLSEKYRIRINGTNWHQYTFQVLNDNINYILKTDYEIGILLSGGLDSSLIAAIACNLLKEKNKVLHAFCSVLPENYVGEDEDERFYIEKLKVYFENLEVHYIVIPENKGPYHNLEEAFEAVEAPVNTFHYVDSALFKKAKELNVRILLSGYGGDFTISYKGNGIPLHYLLKGKIHTTFTLLKFLYKNSTSLRNIIMGEIVNNLPLYKKLKSIFRKDDYYTNFPLRLEFLSKVKQSDIVDNDFKKSLISAINTGQISSDIVEFKKHAIEYNLEYITPFLHKDIFEIVVSVPPKSFIANGIKRNFIREMLKGNAPNEIISRKDKKPYAPDFNKRLIKINRNLLIRTMNGSEIKQSITGIDYEKLKEIISLINQHDNKTNILINKKIFFIPFVLLADQFYEWLKQKS